MGESLCRENSFQDGWLKNEQYQQWLLKDVTDVSMAKCAICRKSFSIASMGESLIAKSNSLRRTAKEKQAQIKELEGTLETKLQELKNS